MKRFQQEMLSRRWKCFIASSAVGFFVLAASCSSQNDKKSFILAERLWTRGKYAEAVAEYEKIIRRGKKDDLEIQATYRAAQTQTLFLGHHTEALVQFETVLRETKSPELIWDTQKQIGEIYYSRLQNYELAQKHYLLLANTRPDAPDVTEFLFRAAKSAFHRLKFDEAISIYEKIKKEYSGSPLAERAEFEIAIVLLTKGESIDRSSGQSGNALYEQALKRLEAFLKTHPSSALSPEVLFAEATCYEEMDQLAKAMDIYETLKTTYPTPHVIEIKLTRIKQRIGQRRK